MIKAVRRPVVLAAGFFDGLHAGHRRVIGRAVARARRIGGEAWVLTFDRHPLRLLHPEIAPPLTSTRHKLRLLEEFPGVDGCLVLPFTRKLASLEPREFVAQLAVCIPRLSEVMVGSNWRFGRGGKGTPALLSRLGRRLGFKVVVIRPIRRGGRIVSSTRVRRLITAGDILQAARLLQRPFSVLGRVGHGRRVARGLGFPTANLAVENEALPPTGVYAVRARVGRGRPWHAGVLNLGVRPTFGGAAGAKPVMELHLLDVKRALYGRDVEVRFEARIREERKFPSPVELARQIAGDVRDTRRLLAGRRRPAAAGRSLPAFGGQTALFRKKAKE